MAGLIGAQIRDKRRRLMTADLTRASGAAAAEQNNLADNVSQGQGQDQIINDASSHSG